MISHVVGKNAKWRRSKYKRSVINYVVVIWSVFCPISNTIISKTPQDALVFQWGKEKVPCGHTKARKKMDH